MTLLLLLPPNIISEVLPVQAVENSSSATDGAGVYYEYGTAVATEQLQSEVIDE